MSRRTHRIGRPRQRPTPQKVLYLDTETWQDHRAGNLFEHRFRLGVSCLATKPPGAASWNLGWKRHRTTESARSAITAAAAGTSPLYVIGSNPVFDLWIIEAFEGLARAGWKPRRPYIADLTCVLDWRKGRRRIVGLASQNFFPCSLAALGEIVGLDKVPVDWDHATEDQLWQRCRRDVDILVRVMSLYFAFVDRLETGAFGYTIASQAFNLYRTRFRSGTIVPHRVPDVLALERAAYHGGRVEAFHAGPIPWGDYAVADVNSLYPSVMTGNRYPVKFIGQFHDESPDRLRSRLRDLCAVARVKISTGIPAYPVRWAGRTVYPIGQFETDLTTPSLQRALDRGDVRQVVRVAYYAAHPIFDAFVQWGWRTRRNYLDAGNLPFALMTKLLLNSLSGKWGQRNPTVTRERSVSPALLARETFYDTPTSAWGVRTALGGMQWVTTGTEEGYYSFPAISAHITDYGRCRMHDLMDAIGWDWLWYMDTDSLFADRHRLAMLDGDLHPTRLGALRLAMPFRQGAIWGVRNYSVGGVRKVAGIRKASLEIAPGIYVTEFWPTLWGLLSRRRAGKVEVRRLEKRLGLTYRKGRVTSDGTVLPWVFPADVPLVVNPPASNSLRSAYRQWKRAAHGAGL